MAELVVEVKKVINVPIEKAFRAWVEPAEMKQWYSPMGMTTPEASSDARKGGEYSVDMKGDTQTFNNTGEYLEFDEPNKLVFTWNDKGSVVTVNFKKLDENKTEVSLHHVGFANEASRAQHNDGWVGVFEKLEKHFA
jgi:uncharacterized protein YndB with AHSA1/START domain